MVPDVYVLSTTFIIKKEENQMATNFISVKVGRPELEPPENFDLELIYKFLEYLHSSQVRPQVDELKAQNEERENGERVTPVFSRSFDVILYNWLVEQNQKNVKGYKVGPDFELYEKEFKRILLGQGLIEEWRTEREEMDYSISPKGIYEYVTYKHSIRLAVNSEKIAISSLKVSRYSLVIAVVSLLTSIVIFFSSRSDMDFKKSLRAIEMNTDEINAESTVINKNLSAQLGILKSVQGVIVQKNIKPKKVVKGRKKD